MTPEDTFDVLADAAQVRHPRPHRDNRGLCPAHGDQNNPGLSFRLSNETGNLIAYCHSQHCSLQSIADAIGVEMRGFFVGGGGGKFSTHIPVTWTELCVLELMKLIPFGYDFDTTVECVFDTLDSDLEWAERPLSDITTTELTVLIGIWLAPEYDYDTNGNWWEWYDKTLRMMHQLNRDTRIDEAASVSAIPRGA